MFENSPEPNLLYAIDRDSQHRLCASVVRRVGRGVVATAIGSEVTFHEPKSEELERAVHNALGPYFNLLGQGTAA